MDQPGPDRTTHPDMVEMQVKLAVAEARLADVTAERNRLAELLEKSLEARTGQPGIRFFERLFRR